MRLGAWGNGALAMNLGTKPEPAPAFYMYMETRIAWGCSRERLVRDELCILGLSALCITPRLATSRLSVWRSIMSYVGLSCLGVAYSICSLFAARSFLSQLCLRIPCLAVVSSGLYHLVSILRAALSLLLMLPCLVYLNIHFGVAFSCSVLPLGALSVFDYTAHAYSLKICPAVSISVF